MNMEKRGVGFSNIYYGWIIVAVALISLAFWFGIRTSFSVFYVAFLENFPWSRSEAAGIQSMALITSTIMAPVVGGLIDRFGPRGVIGSGVLLLALGLILCAAVNTLTQFYLLYGVVMSAGVSCIGVISYSAILAHWFEKKRGLASGIALSGMGLGPFLLVPLCQYFISLWGWRFTFVLLGGLALIILLPVNMIFLRHRPQELGLYPDGLKVVEQPSERTTDVINSNLSDTDWTLKKVLRTGRFWALVAFPSLAIAGIFIIMVHNVKFLVDEGIDKMTAAFVFALLGVICSFFRILWGWLSDRFGRERTYTIGTTFICIGIGSLVLINTLGKNATVYLFLIFFGMGWGATAPMIISTAADLFKGKVFGLIYGLVEAGIGIGGAFGAWVAGFIFDKTQSYQWAFVLAIILFILSCLFMWLTAPRKVLAFK